jgi:hypothetical protein
VRKWRIGAHHYAPRVALMFNDVRPNEVFPGLNVVIKEDQ